MTKLQPEAAHKLHYELTNQVMDFQMLVDDTVARIGDIAQVGYDALKDGSASAGRPRIRVASQYRNSGIGTMYITEHPANPLRDVSLVPDSDLYTVSCMYAEDQQRRVSVAGKSFGISSVDRSLCLTTQKLSDDDVYARRPSHAQFAITTTGAATHQQARTYTAPVKSIGRPKDYAALRFADVLHYMSPEELRDGYAKAYTGALAVAMVIGTSLDVYGAKAKTEPLLELIDAWQETRATEAGGLDVSIARTIPTKLALRAGASFNA